MSLKFYNEPPYYDDFDQTKNYLRVLFRPGYSVQARELTQLQTAIQAQIDRFGQHVFKDGSQVIGGQVAMDVDFAYVKIDSAADAYYNLSIGETLTGESGVTAIVLAATASTDDDPLTIFVKYNKTGTDNTTQVFAAEEELSFEHAGTPYTFTVLGAASNPTGYGTRVSVTEGVFFVSGNFVYNPAASIIVSKYTNVNSAEEDRPNARVVYKITEGIITSGDDETLNDNALGSPNEAAPGAHRYQIQLDLNLQPLEFADRDEDDIIQLMVIEKGLIRQTARTEYSALGDVLAQRTFEESGNYTVRPFQINVREHLNDELGNGGLYTAAQGGDATKLAVGLEPSVAYVNGYRIEIEATKYVNVDKARDEAYFNAASVLAPLGNYIRIDNVVSQPDINNFSVLNLRNSSDTNIGTARVRSIQYVTGSGASAEYRLFIFDVTMNSGQVFSSVDNVYHSYGSSAAFTADLIETTVYDVGNNCSIFKLPVDAVQTLLTPENYTDILYYVRKKYDYREASGSEVTIAAATDEIFESSSTSEWIVTNATTGALVTPTITINSGGASITFGSLSTGEYYDFTGPSRRNIREKTKTLQLNATKTIGSPNTTPGGYDSLGKADVLRIKSVIQSTGSVNITDRYILDNGQRDNFYDVAQIQLKPGATAPAGQIVVTFDYFTHGAGDYFSVNSYTFGGTGADAFTYEDIPYFQGIRGLIQLRDALDFRPVKDQTGANFTGTGASLVSMITPTSIVTTDIQYYLPRVDKIYVDKRGNFGAVKGISSVNPQPPPDPKDSMVLYMLRLGAFTFGPADAVPTMVDNKRYTMRDIGNIDKRVTKLEYYTSLSLLEKDTADTQIFADGGAVRFKNGFVVDGFYGHNVGAVTNADYKVSMDKTKGQVRPLFNEDNAKLYFNADDSTDVVRTGPLVTLNYTEVSAGIEQPYASYAEFVNPYNVFTWAGDLKLSPETDEWKETLRRPDVVVDQSGIYDSLKFMADETEVFGTVWNEWQTNWTGTPTTEVNVDTNTQNDWFGVTTTSTTTLTTTTPATQARTGIRTSLVPDTVTTNLGDRTVEINFVPFIRSRKIFFKGTKMKPNTKVYAFFDGSDVTDYVREELAFNLYADRTDVDSYLNFTSHPSGSSNLITDTNGEVIGSFVIPNNDILKFKTGVRVFRLTDSITNANDATTYAEALYDARGLLETKENLAISTRVARVDRAQVTESRTIFETSVATSVTQSSEPVTWIDPVAQTFITDAQGGIFATAIDIYFAQKDSTVPVTLQVRICENGIPTQRIVPFSQVIKPAANVNTSTDATVATKFVFEAPVHLIQGVEYALVLISNSDEYKVWVSELGGYDVSNPLYRITKQPYNGVFFKSQNASTWTPDQSKDIKFKVYRASFVSSGDAIFNEVNLPTRLLINSPLQTTNSSNIVKVLHKNHGHFAGISNVTLSGVAATSGSAMNGIPIAELNTTHTVVDVEADTYTIQVTTNANTSGRAGGNVVYATENRTMNVFQPMLNQVVLPGTQSLLSAKITSGQSLAGTETPNNVSANYISVKANDNTYLNAPGTIVSQPNYSLLGGFSRSFWLKSEFSTILENISPVIDLDRLSVVTIANRIDNPTGTDPAPSGYNYVDGFVAETAASAGSALSRYITRRIDLNDPASALKIYVLANKPAAAGIATYYKMLTTGSDANFDSLGWTLVAPDAAIPSTENPNDFSEIQYTVDETDLSNKQFTSFAVKIVFTSTNSSAVPVLRDFRAIAVT